MYANSCMLLENLRYQVSRMTQSWRSMRTHDPEVDSCGRKLQSISAPAPPLHVCASITNKVMGTWAPDHSCSNIKCWNTTVWWGSQTHSQNRLNFDIPQHLVKIPGYLDGDKTNKRCRSNAYERVLGSTIVGSEFWKVTCICKKRRRHFKNENIPPGWYFKIVC